LFTLCAGEKFWTIGQYLAKIWTKVAVAYFLAHPVSSFMQVSSK